MNPINGTPAAILTACATAVLSASAGAAAPMADAPAASASAPPPAAGMEVLQQRARALLERVEKQLVYFPGGTFEMGAWLSEEGLPYEMDSTSTPVHTVTLHGFSVMAYKVTYEDFDLFTDIVGEQRVDMNPLDADQRSPHTPAGVNWYGAKNYCQWLAKLSGLPFDLLTEAQWEYAARSGGKKVLFATDNGDVDLDKNFPNGWHLKIQRTPDVGSYPPNPAGLYGMLDYEANEWVNDWYDPDYYRHSPEIDPPGPASGKPALARAPEFGPAKVVRGLPNGSSPKMGGFVFSRAGREPRNIRSMESHPGYSDYPTHQFRCAVQGTKS